MKKEFHKISLTRFAPTIAKISGVSAPIDGDKEVVDEVIDLVKKTTGKETVDKVLIYNPDAIGRYFYEKYKEKIFAPLDNISDIKVPFLTMIPPKTPVCFGTMFTGATPEVHGIQKYEKQVITIDSLFDVWAREGKKVALISNPNQSIPKIFANRNINYYPVKYDTEAVEKALELIANSDYDIIEVYNQEYDDMLHVTYPNSYFCRRAARKYVKNYVKLVECVKEHWKGKSILTTFSPDHGGHRVLNCLLGTHGQDIPEDRNIYHFFTAIAVKE